MHSWLEHPERPPYCEQHFEEESEEEAKPQAKPKFRSLKEVITHKKAKEEAEAASK